MSVLASSVTEKGFRGVMVWYASVKNGFQYGVQDDATSSVASQGAFVTALKTLMS
jgi:hypothetical protein